MVELPDVVAGRGPLTAWAPGWHHHAGRQTYRAPVGLCRRRRHVGRRVEAWDFEAVVPGELAFTGHGGKGSAKKSTSRTRGFSAADRVSAVGGLQVDIHYARVSLVRTKAPALRKQPGARSKSKGIQTMNTVAKNLEKALGDGCYATAYEIDGNHYIVTTGTGDGCFAYDADDVERFLDKLDGAEFDYNDFCQDVSPSADRYLAEALATHDVRIARGGSCMSVLTDAEYAAANSREIVGEVLS